MDDLVTVRFVVADAPFVAGQEVEVSRPVAEKLVERSKVAEYVRAEKREDPRAARRER